VNPSDLDRLLEIGELAARVIMRVYATPFAVDFKGKDDPVTVADREANTLLCEHIARDFPGVPIVSEENDPATFAEGLRASEAFFVDPLDGTREFVAKNGEFCVMLGLTHEGRAVAGVVVCPALERSFAGSVGAGAFEVAKDGSRRAIRVSSTGTLADARVVVSRSRRTQTIEIVQQHLGVREVLEMGSAGVKGARVACGEAEVYVQPGPAGKRWDACAPDALVRAAGGAFTDVQGALIDYASGELENSGGMVATNGALHEAVLAKVKRRDA
jgi:3'(2'), 5'-bisphosphate nucleotidase